MRLHVPFALAVLLAAPSVSACTHSEPEPAGQPPPRLPPGGRLPPRYDGPLDGTERVAWLQQVGAGTQVAEFTFVIYVDGKKQPLRGAECKLLDGSRHHLCEAPLPSLAPGKHTLRFGAVRIVDGKEKASELSEPLTVTRDLSKGAS
jgi:hypothetical protein